MSKSKKQQELKPETIKKGIKETRIEINWLQERAEKIRVQIDRLEGTIRNYQDRCPHPYKKLDDEGHIGFARLVVQRLVVYERDRTTKLFHPNSWITMRICTSRFHLIN